jgi:hypothetical protein
MRLYRHRAIFFVIPVKIVSPIVATIKSSRLSPLSIAVKRFIAQKWPCGFVLIIVVSGSAKLEVAILSFICDSGLGPSLRDETKTLRPGIDLVAFCHLFLCNIGVISSSNMEGRF